MTIFKFFESKKSKTSDHPRSIDSKWINLVGKALANYSSLSRDERIWFNLRILNDAFHDGGLISYYYNSGATHVYDAMEDLEAIGLDTVSEIIRKYNELLFHGSEVPVAIDERNELISNLDEKTDSLLEDLESDFQLHLEILESELEAFVSRGIS